MATYRVTIPVTFDIDINESNVETAPRPLLNGDSCIIATRRAIWCLNANSNGETRKQLGVKRMLITGKWENFPVEVVEPRQTPDAAETSPV